jgi:hypothetical protein
MIVQVTDTLPLSLLDIASSSQPAPTGEHQQSAAANSIDGDSPKYQAYLMLLAERKRMAEMEEAALAQLQAMRSENLKRENEAAQVFMKFHEANLAT